MNTINSIYQELNTQGLVDSKETFSIKWAGRNKNWLTYTQHKRRDGCLEVLLNIQRQALIHQQHYESVKRRMGWLAEDSLLSINKVIKQINIQLEQRYGITRIETKAA